MAIDRRVVWAVVGTVLVVGTLMWFAGDAAAPGVGGQPRSQARDARTQPDGQTPPDVKLEALGTNREGPVDQGRNPFRFRPKPAPPPVSPPPSPFGAAAAKNESGGAPGLTSVPSGPPPPPPIQLKLIGIVKRGSTMIAVLTDGQEPEHGIEGQIILGRYRLLKVNADSVEIAYEDGRGRTTLRLPPQ